MPRLHRCCRLDAFPLAMLSVAMTVLAGCRSAHIDATVANQTAARILLVQVDYPSASFGAQSIAPGQDFKYRFKVLGSGPANLTYTDSTQKEHTSTGPTLSEGSEGTLDVFITESGVHWQPALTAK